MGVWYAVNEGSPMWLRYSLLFTGVGESSVGAQRKIYLSYFLDLCSIAGLNQCDVSIEKRSGALSARDRLGVCGEIFEGDACEIQVRPSAAYGD
jgi:hypothetical protein